MGVTSPRRSARVAALADDVPVLVDDGNAARPGHFVRSVLRDMDDW